MTDTHPLPPACGVAFKEWAGVCAELASGRQVIILRKGGVAEGPGGFRPEHDTFWLYPTRLHEARQGLRGPPTPDEPTPDGTVPIAALARVEFVARIERPEVLDRLEPFHAWTAETVRKRFEYRTPGLWLLAVRAYRRDPAWPLPDAPEHAGCHSWVPLEQPIPTAGLRPAVSDEEFRARIAALRQALAEPAPAGPPPRPGDLVREAPATAFLLFLWLAVYLAMAWQQGSLHAGGNLATGGILRPVGDLFGSMTGRQLESGQIWRAWTATCVHWSLVHLGLNMLVLYQLGPLVEEWYGSWLFLGWAAVVGGLGNLVAAFSKSWLASLRGVPGSLDVPAAGGSVLICALMALVAVVGWRSRTRTGAVLSNLMIGLLAFCGLMGALLPFVDNYGHAGGAIVGGVAGLVHRPLLRLPGTRLAKLIGLFGLALLAGAGLAQREYAHAAGDVPPRTSPPSPSRAQRLVESLRRGQVAWNDLQAMHALYALAGRLPDRPGARSDPLHGIVVGPTRQRLVIQLRGLLVQLEASGLELRTGEERAALGGIKEQIAALGPRRPTPGEIVQFRSRVLTLAGRAASQMAEAQKALIEMGAIRRQPAPKGQPAGPLPPPNAAPSTPPGGSQ